MRLAIYVADEPLRNDLLVWAATHCHVVLEDGPAVPPAEAAGAPWPLFALERAVARLEPDAVLVDYSWDETWREMLCRGAERLAGKVMDEQADLQRTDWPAAPSWLWAVLSEADAQARAERFARARLYAQLSGGATADAAAPTTHVPTLVHYGLRAAALTPPLGPETRVDDGAPRDLRAWQEGAFVELLRAATWDDHARRRAAVTYHHALEATQAEFELEMAAALSTEDVELYRLREQACRWLAVIAHLVPGSSGEDLPPAVPPLANHRYVHDLIGVSHHYAFYCVTYANPGKAAQDALWPLLSKVPDLKVSPDREWPRRAGRQMWASLAFCRAAARAHLAALDHWLGPLEGSYSAVAVTRVAPAAPLPAAARAVLSFWGWGKLLAASPAVTNTLAAAVRAGANLAVDPRVCRDFSAGLDYEDATQSWARVFGPDDAGQSSSPASVPAPPTASSIPVARTRARGRGARARQGESRVEAAVA